MNFPFNEDTIAQTFSSCIQLIMKVMHYEILSTELKLSY